MSSPENAKIESRDGKKEKGSKRKRTHRAQRWGLVFWPRVELWSSASCVILYVEV